MRNIGFYTGVGLVILAVVIFGLMANTPRTADPRPATAYSRGHLPSDGLASNFDLASVDRANARSAAGGYPPRAFALSAQRKPPSDSWLLDADSDRERFRRIEVSMRGLDIHMAEIGARFGLMHDAIGRQNLRLAELEADKSIESARIAMLKRPGFGGDEGLKYMGAAQWTALLEALRSGDAARSQTAFLEVRQSCMACHTARGMEFLNDSALFESTAQFLGRPATVADGPSSDIPPQTQGIGQ